MSLIHRLKPAEHEVLLHGSKASIKNLMKLTFMDLMLKNVLVVQESVNTYKRGRRTREVKTKYVIKGRNFDKYVPSSFELIYLTTFQQSPGIKAIFVKLIQVAYEQIKSDAKFRKSVWRSSAIESCFRVTTYDWLARGFSLTEEGKVMRTQVEQELKQIDEQLANGRSDNLHELGELIQKIGGNVFLLKNIDIQQLKRIDTEIYRSLQERRSYSESSDIGYWAYFDEFTFDYFLDTSCDIFESAFDSGFDSLDTSSTFSGCSSCSGCSGCGGCGGCS